METILDRTGFPMVRVEPLGAYLGLLPLAKIQFEQFLCETADDGFGPRWYDEVLSLNPRISPYSVTASNYWRAFITGVLPGEAERFARWMGEDYRLPTWDEWTTAYRYLRRPDAAAPGWRPEAAQAAPPRCRALLDGIEQACQGDGGSGAGHGLADRMLMRHGVMEWVELPGQQPRWGGMGDAAPGLAGLLFDPDAGEPHRPYHPDSERIAFYGCRLLRKEAP